jgi:hypothetical protein
LIDAQRLVLIRGLHTVIYVVMAGAVFGVLFASIAGVRDWWVWIAASLVAIETFIFIGSCMKCPMTALAARYGGNSGDTFLPERLTRHTLIFFGPLIVIALMLMIARWSGFLA